MKKRYGIGIDSSNYKTSMALIDSDSNLIKNLSEFLKVKRGELGLRQETAFFMHAERLPVMYEELLKDIDRSEIGFVAVSNAPRRKSGSYMPVFIAGVNAAKMISSTLSIPLYEFSHQEGHIESIMQEFNIEKGERFIFAHLSGGTTEFLLTYKTSDAYECEIVGGTKDISLGQLIDRLGVLLGYDFPSGKYLDQLANEYHSNLDQISLDHKTTDEIKISRPKIQDGYFNLSGPETEIKKLLERGGADIAKLAAAVFDMISDLLIEEALYLSKKYSDTNKNLSVFLAGGVSSSEYIRKRIASSSANVSIYFGSPELSGDNAVGIALLGKRKEDDLHRKRSK